MYKRFAIFSALFGLGFISISTQIYLLREFLYVFQGNELVFGVVLANWMLLTGFGAYIGRFSQQIKNREPFLLFLLILLSVIPILTVLKLDIWRCVVFPTGTMVGLRDIFYSSLLLQTPVCFLSGFLFTALASSLSKPKGRNPLGGAYAVESLGSMVAGALVNFVFLWTMGSFPGMKIIAVIFLGTVVIYSFFQHAIIPKIAVPLFAGGIIYALFSFSLTDFSLAMLYEGQDLVVDRETPYGRVVVTEQSGQQNVYENGVLLFSSGNVIRNEESVHFAMIQHDDPKKILLLSGGLSGAIPEIMKYNPVRVDYVELNPALTEMSEELGLQEEIPGVRFINADARRHITHTDSIYDVALIKLPEPATLQVNRYYTDDFFRILKRKLGSDGVVSMSLPTGSDYISEEAGKLNSCLYNTMKKHFEHVVILPSGQNYFLASDDSLSLRIPTMIMDKGIETNYVNRWYFDEKLLQDRSRFVMSQLDETVGVNYDFHPVAYFFQQSYWLSYFRQNYALIGGLICLLIVLTFLALNPVNAGLFAAGFTATSTEIILLLGFQITFGYVYQTLGVLIMVFMLGLALGAGSRRLIFREGRKKYYLLLQLMLAALAILILIMITLIPAFRMADTLLFALFLILSFSVAFLTGLEFSFASLLSKGGQEKVAANNYSVDLYGSALGALLTAVFFLPLVGISGTLLFLGILNTSTAVLFYITKRNE